MARKAPDNSEIDPKGLIAESYRMPRIGPPECRSIFLDWALGVPAGMEPQPLIAALLARYEGDNPNHPMTEVLRAALSPAPTGGRRGGAMARRRDPA